MAQRTKWLVSVLGGVFAACSGGGGEAPGIEESPTEVPSAFELAEVYASTTLSPEWGAVLESPARSPNAIGFRRILASGLVDSPRTIHLGGPAVRPDQLRGTWWRDGWLLAPDGLSLGEPFRSFPGTLGDGVGTGFTSSRRWNAASGEWEWASLFTGDERFGLYGRFPYGLVRVSLENIVSPALAPLGIRVRRTDGPLPPRNGDDVAYRRSEWSPTLNLHLDVGESKELFLLGGEHLFQVQNVATGVIADLTLLTPGFDALGFGEDGVDSMTVAIGFDHVTSEHPEVRGVHPYSGLSGLGNRAPVVVANALTPPGVSVRARDTGGAPGPESRQLILTREAPAAFDEVLPFVTMLASATDPEGRATLSSVVSPALFSGGPEVPIHTSESWVREAWLSNDTLHVVFYDEVGLAAAASFAFREQREPPPIAGVQLRVDRDLVDYGRRAVKRAAGCAPANGGLEGLADWIDTDGDGVGDAARYSTLEVVGDPADPDQDPGGLVALYALVSPEALESIQFAGGIADEATNGSFYAAWSMPLFDIVVGQRLDDAQRAQYSNRLWELARHGFLPVNAEQFPDVPRDWQAIPILFEAPPFECVDGVVTNDCAEFGGADPEFGLAYLSLFVGAQASSRVAWPDDATSFTTNLTLVPVSIEPRAGEGLTLQASTFPRARNTEIVWRVESTDGMVVEQALLTDAEGRSTLSLPPAEAGTKHAVTAICRGTRIEVTYSR